MTLRLSVVSEHGMRLGTQSTKVFGVHGGGIGRGSDNEWILPDPERYLSGKHARVDFRAGSYILVDLSSNGTFINGAGVPLGKQHDYVLKDGDYLRLGEYELMVSIEQGNDFPPDRSAIVAYDGRSPSSAVTKSTAEDLGAEIDVNALLEGTPLATDSGVRPRNAYGQPPSLPATEHGEGGAVTPWHLMTRPLLAGAASAPPVLHDEVDQGLAAFCRGAGIDPRTLSPEARGAALKIAGQLLRESVLGLLDLNQSGSEFCNQFRIARAAEDAPESPLNFARGVDEALLRLLNSVSTRATAIKAIRDNFRELKAQNTAALAAMRAAFEEFVERVDPKDLEQRFERGAKRGVFGTQNKARYWDLYAEMFPALTQRPSDGFPHVFTETFAKAFEAKLRTLIPPPRNAVGAS